MQNINIIRYTNKIYTYNVISFKISFIIENRTIKQLKIVGNDY